VPRVTDTTSRARREGRVLVDWLQNDRSRSLVAPYSLRATPWPTVSTPIGWEEIESVLAARDLGSLIYLPADVLDRLDRLDDPFRPVLEVEQALPTEG
jgi:bifunctional non-homologous end joining protein LigD